MKRLLSNVAYGLGGVLLLVVGVALMLNRGVDKTSVFAVVGGCMLVLMSWAFFWQDKKENVHYFTGKRTASADARKGVKMALELPFEKLHAQFQSIAEHDEVAVAENGYLSWNSGSFAEIRIVSCGAENWLGVFWVRATRGMSNAVLKSICTANGMALPESLCGMKPHGIVIYNAGVLQVYPASLEEDFKEAFLSTVLSGADEFQKWVSEYYEEA
ncbi:MAG: hypothetical protein IKZ10_08285 [Akkermansia sp.]|nr:hypothetical protein [Akkermansia sp.]